MPRHRSVDALVIRCGRDTKCAPILAAIHYIRPIELIDQLRALARHRPDKSKQADITTVECCDVEARASFLGYQSCESAPGDSGVGCDVPHLAQCFVVCPQCDQPIGKITNICWIERRIESARPEHPFACKRSLKHVRAKKRFDPGAVQLRGTPDHRLHHTTSVCIEQRVGKLSAQSAKRTGWLLGMFFGQRPACWPVHPGVVGKHQGRSSMACCIDQVIHHLWKKGSPLRKWWIDAVVNHLRTSTCLANMLAIQRICLHSLDARRKCARRAAAYRTYLRPLLGKCLHQCAAGAAGCANDDMKAICIHRLILSVVLLWYLPNAKTSH